MFSLKVYHVKLGEFNSLTVDLNSIASRYENEPIYSAKPTSPDLSNTLQLKGPGLTLVSFCMYNLFNLPCGGFS